MLIRSFTLAGAVISALLCLGTDVRNGKLILLFLGLWLGAFVGICLLYLLVLWFFSRFIGKEEPEQNDHPFARKVLVWTIEAICGVARAKLVVEGKELLPEGRFLLVSNHRSNFDPLVTVLAFREHDMAFVSKKGNLKLPIVGRWIRYCNYLSIDRENPRNAIRTINAAADYLKRDLVSVGIYPEGTRNLTDEMLPFHDGVMMIAQKAGVPIAVVTVRDTEKIVKNFPFRSTRVEIAVKGVIPAEQVASSRSNELSAEARKMMEA